MRVLTSRIDLHAFLARIPLADERVLMLDYDGTLAPFHVRPECALPYPEVTPVLEKIIQSGDTRVVIVSGRPALELPPLLALPKLPEIWGSHGRERLLPDGTRSVAEPPTDARDALAAAASAIAAVLSSGARLEQKLASIALHWRGLPAGLAGTLESLAQAQWEPFLRAHPLELLPFDQGLELRIVGCTKQHAVEAVLSDTREGCAVAYLGDDLTDEDAFRAVKARGLAVLVRNELRETAADVWIQPPHELIAFLQHWLHRQDSNPAF